MKKTTVPSLVLIASLAIGTIAVSHAQNLVYHLPLNETEVTPEGDPPTWELNTEVNTLVPGFTPFGVLEPQFGSASPGGAVNGSTGSVGTNNFGRIELGDVSPAGGAFTITLHFKMHDGAPTGGQRYIINSNSDHDERWNLHVQNGESLRFFHDSSDDWGTTGSGSAVSVSANAVDLTTTFEQDRWYHFGITRDSSDVVTFYIDGVEVWSAIDSGAFTDAAEGVWLGRKTNFGTTGFAGLFDDIRFYDDALSSEQIQGLAIPEPSTYAAILGALMLAGVVFLRRRRERR